jgi:hypothetical protein
VRERSALILIASCVFVSLAIFVGFELYTTYETTANKQAILNSMNALAEDAYQYHQRPVSMGGGGGDYSNYRIPYGMIRTTDGLFTTEPLQNHLLITGISRPLNGRIEAEVDEKGKIVRCTFEGDFR